MNFNTYTTLPNISNILKNQHYASIFTSHNYPYLYNYYHNIFNKHFI